METDKILKAIGALESKVDSLSKQVTAHDAKLRWITSVALLVIEWTAGVPGSRATAWLDGTFDMR